MFQELSRIVIPARGVRSLCWVGESLVDLVSGGTRYPVPSAAGEFRLELRVQEGKQEYGANFDHAIVSSDGRYAVLLERLGTKGLLLKEGKVLRTISRNPFKANRFEYPAALFLSPEQSKMLLAHCPEHYGKLEFEEADTGKRLTRRSTTVVPFFHSRLQVSPDGRYLLSAGWVRKPWDALCLFEINKVLKTPSILDQYGSVDEREEYNLLGWGDEDVHSASFFGDDFLILANAEERENEAEEFSLFPNRVGLYSLSQKKLLSVAALDEIIGTLIPLDQSHVLGFYEYPKVINIESGDLLNRWVELQSGRQNSSIIHHLDMIPPLALDAKNRRFALADQEKITVLQLGKALS